MLRGRVAIETESEEQLKENSEGELVIGNTTISDDLAADTVTVDKLDLGSDSKELLSHIVLGVYRENDDWAVETLEDTGSIVNDFYVDTSDDDWFCEVDLDLPDGNLEYDFTYCIYLLSTVPDNVASRNFAMKRNPDRSEFALYVSGDISLDSLLPNNDEGFTFGLDVWFFP